MILCLAFLKRVKRVSQKKKRKIVKVCICSFQASVINPKERCPEYRHHLLFLGALQEIPRPLSFSFWFVKK